MLLLTAPLFALAQNRCVAPADLQVQVQKTTVNPAADLLTGNNITHRSLAEEDVIRIPVVVHVLYNNAAQNISDAQIKSGMEALNRDFRRRNADTTNTPLNFRHLAADVQIEFYLATADVWGRATTGIVRKWSTRSLWMADDKMKASATGGDDPWDCKSYLNIWIVDLVGGSGYASVPGTAPATDGVVINYRAFGSINTAAPFQLGRTAVHEVGHWLGLKHIWGDTPCGDDGIADTPQQGFFTKGCPSGFRSSCNNGETGDMYMNYMDYTDDACMNLFTIGQRTRMRSLFAAGGPRATLLLSKALNEAWVQESPAVNTAMAALYPNPASTRITVAFTSAMLGKNVHVYNAQGQLQKTETVVSLQQVMDVSKLPSGVYFVKGEGYLQKFSKL